MANLAMMIAITMGQLSSGEALSPCLDSALMAADASNLEHFGWDVAMRGDWVAVGAPYAPILPSLDHRRGAIHVFWREGSAYVEKAKLQVNDEASTMWLGMNIAMSQDFIVAGTWASQAAGHYAGAAYVFSRRGTTWEFEAKLLAPDAVVLDRFGTAVAVDGDWIAVGAPYQDEAGSNGGAVYMFRRHNHAWAFHSKIMHESIQPQDHLGSRLVLQGTRLITNATGADGVHPDTGALFVFEYDTQLDQWVERSRLCASDSVPGDLLGVRVAMHEDVIVAGAWLGDNHSSWAGAYVYRWHESEKRWVEEAILTEPNGGNNSYVYWDVIAVGNDLIASGVLMNDTVATNAGSVFLYRFDRQSRRWRFDNVVFAPETTSEGHFGRSVAIDSDSMVVGMDEAIGGGYRSGMAVVYTGLQEACGGGPCAADIAPLGGQGIINVDDLLGVIDGWGSCEHSACVADTNGDETINHFDLLTVIYSWGPCEQE